MKGSNVVFIEDTGNGALAAELRLKPCWKLLRIELKMSAAPTTSENLTISRDAKRGSSFDFNYYTRDLSVGSVTDLCVPFGNEYVMNEEDEIAITYNNTDGNTWAYRAVIELLED